MAISSGSRLGSYEILQAIGAGGMGEVYRARDTRLDRVVAIKVLPPQLSDAVESRERFEREARVISSLNHPNICVLHDIGRQDGIDFLVMEFLDGESLAQRLARGPLALDLALKYAIEIASALDAAHRQGVTHRDLKPGNIMLTKVGAKLLDFGLAKLKPRSGPVQSLSEMPTAASIGELTAQGSILGTLQYMSPEQLEGTEADARSDIFAFGAMLYEMLTGKKAFEGKSQVSLMAAILEHEPIPLRTRQPLAPPLLEHLITRCLAKHPDQRWQTSSDVALELKWLASQGASSLEAETRSESKAVRQPASRTWILAAAVGIVLGSLAVFGALAMRSVPEAPSLRFDVNLPEGVKFIGSAARSFSASPDGRRLAFVAQGPDDKTRVWVRALDSFTAQPLAGTEGAEPIFSWAPDSRQLLFTAQGKLKKSDITGGQPQTIADGIAAARTAWSQDGTIIFENRAGINTGPLFRISAAGGAPAPLTSLDKDRQEVRHSWPSFLPDGHHFIYSVSSSDAQKSGLFVGDTDSTERKQIMNSDWAAVYAPPGYLLFLRETALMAQRFDAEKLELSGEPFRIADNVMRSALDVGVSVSGNGVLSYRTGDFAGSSSSFVWFDRHGMQTPVKEIPVGAVSGMALSPDGKNVAFARQLDASNPYNIWLHDFVRGVTSRFTVNPFVNAAPKWSPDGNDVLFFSTRGSGGIYKKSASGARDDELIVNTPQRAQVEDVSSDGRFLMIQGTGDLKILSLKDDKEPLPFSQTGFNEREGRFSPNTRWVAYTSSQSGQDQIYIGSISASGLWQISRDGGRQPRWRRDGKELFFLSLEGRMMAVTLEETANAMQAGLPVELFDARFPFQELGGNYLVSGNSRNDYDVTADGQRFLIAAQDAASDPIHVVINWTALLGK